MRSRIPIAAFLTILLLIPVFPNYEGPREASAIDPGTIVGIIGIGVTIFGVAWQSTQGAALGNTPSITPFSVEFDDPIGDFNVADSTKYHAKFTVDFGHCTDSDNGWLIGTVSTKSGKVSFTKGPFGAVKKNFDINGPLVGMNVGNDWVEVKVKAKGEKCGFLWDSYFTTDEEKDRKNVPVNPPYSLSKTVSPQSLIHGQRTIATLSVTSFTIGHGIADLAYAHSTQGKTLELPPAPTINSAVGRQLLEHEEGHDEEHLCPADPGFDTKTITLSPFIALYRIPAKSFKPISPPSDWISTESAGSALVSDTIYCQHEDLVGPPVPPIRHDKEEMPDDPPGDSLTPVETSGIFRFIGDDGGVIKDNLNVTISDGYGNTISNFNFNPSTGDYSFSGSLGFFLNMTYGGGSWYLEQKSSMARPVLENGTELFLARTLTPVIIGTVTNQLGNPLLAEISLADGTKELLTVSESSGSFTIASVPKTLIANSNSMKINITAVPSFLGQTFIEKSKVISVTIDSQDIDLGSIIMQERVSSQQTNVMLSGVIRQKDYLSNTIVPVTGLKLDINAQDGSSIASITTDANGEWQTSVPTQQELIIKSPNGSEFGVDPLRSNSSMTVKLVEDYRLEMPDLPRSKPSIKIPKVGDAVISGLCNPDSNRLATRINGQENSDVGCIGGSFTVQVSPLKLADKIEVFEVFNNVGGSPATAFVLNVSISNGNIGNIELNPGRNSLIMDTTGVAQDSILTVVIPRDLLDAKEGALDVSFIVLVDGDEVTIQEVNDPDGRKLIVNLPAGTQIVEIIGSTSVPEFSTILLTIVLVSILTIGIIAGRRHFVGLDRG